jgi:enamine deaminase RidA (YjgF/YER057c/UK114 family)
MKRTPIPQGKYIPASRYGNLVYTSGMTPRNKGLLFFRGKIKVSEPIETYKEAVRLAAGNALTAARSVIRDQERLERIVTLTIFIAVEQGFVAHAKVADFAAEYFYEQLGEDGIGSRAAIGVASLPGDAPVEIQLVAAITDPGRD